MRESNIDRTQPKILVKILARCCLLSCLLWVASCDPIARLASQAQFEQRSLKTDHFRHQVFINPSGQKPSIKHWHIYIEGDGRAVNRFGKPNPDPTPRHSMALQMMAQDPAPALYLGRPCHFVADHNCTPQQWTLARYSETTVSSMVQALQILVQPSSCLTLVGHSGGGTLAALMAERLANPLQLVTLAGNLQVKKWTQYHGYTALSLSLDPGQRPVLPDKIAQLHIAGEADEEILWQWIAEYSKNQPNSHFVNLNGVSHQQNWPNWWQANGVRLNFNQNDCGIVTPSNQR